MPKTDEEVTIVCIECYKQSVVKYRKNRYSTRPVICNSCHQKNGGHHREIDIHIATAVKILIHLGRKNTEITELLNVSRCIVSDIRCGRSWRQAQPA
jgi:hypothetical protein